MRITIKKILMPLMMIGLISYSISYIIYGFFGEEGQVIIAHGTGLITMVINIIVGLMFVFYCNKSKLLKYLGIISNLGMALSYFLYLFLEISPSNFIVLSHVASSILFDITTSGQSLTNLVALAFITTLIQDNNNGNIA